MGFPLSIPPTLEHRLRPGTRVLLALSGGVDSATALALLTELGCDEGCYPAIFGGTAERIFGLSS